MTTLREAAQQALEALEEVNKSPWLEDCYHAFDDEVTALRAALAEPVPDHATIAEWQADKQRKPRHISYVCPQCHWSLDERKPLTEEEMLNIIDDVLEGGSLVDVARAIERAHGIMP